MYIFSRKIKRHLPHRGNQEETTFEKLSKKQYRRRFLGHSWEGFFVNINTREDLKRAEEWVTREEKIGDLASDDTVRYSTL
jgi:NDP-sugar pyrophosphorylase family protein